MTKRIDQLLAGFADGDAISQEARLLQNALRCAGYESDIYAPTETTAPAVADHCRPLSSYANTERQGVIFHYSIASEACRHFTESSGKRIVRYHNITPEHFLRGFDDQVATQLRDARSQLPAIASQCDAVWAVSDFNAGELRELGIQNVRTVPLFFHPTALNTHPQASTLEKYGDELENILFVGRMAPNKCVEDLILAFGWYQKVLNPMSRLVLVGSQWSCPRYFAMLRALANRLDLPNVCFEGFLNDEALIACYQTASLFVCPSRHEGYCLPLVEAMCHDVPVIARHEGGMPEAMGNSGVLYESDDPRELASLIDHTIRNPELRESILRGQAERLTSLRTRDLETECRELLTSLD